jgi:hypothetical protein
MKKLLTTYAIAGFIFSAAAPALADDVLPPPWIGENRTVYAAWGDWTDFPGPMLPDYWGSVPEGPGDPLSLDVAEDPVLLSEYEGRYNVIQLNQDDELFFGLPNFEDGLYKEVWIQVTYYLTTQELYPLFDIYTQEPATMADVIFEDIVEWNDGWVTEAWSFQIRPNPIAEEISLDFSLGQGQGQAYPVYVDQVVIDTMCIPEPATICLLGLGALSLIRIKKQ